MRGKQRLLPASFAALCVAIGDTPWPEGLRAQSARDLLLQAHEAYDLAEFDRAIGLFSLGLNPMGTPQDSLWVSGLHKLADALISTGSDSLAAAWLRWGLRLMPDLAVDSVNFPPPVVAAFLAASRFVKETPLPRVATGTWRWPATRATTGNGTLVIESAETPITGRIEGGGFLASGIPQVLRAGSYNILVTGEGYLPARAVVEVLPGITTVLRFTLDPAVAGLLYVASRPWGTVLVNGRRIGYTTIAAYPLPQGRHHVRVERPGYLPFDTTVTIERRDQRVRLGPIILRPRPER